MKLLILALNLLSLSTPVFGGGFAPLEKPGFDEKTYSPLHEFADQCKQAEGYECYDIDACPLYKCDLVDSIGEKKVYTGKEKVFDCTTEEECEIARSTHCIDVPSSDFIYAMKANDGYEMYCATYKFEPTVIGKELKVNPTKYTNYLADLRAKKEAEENLRATKAAKCMAMKNANIDQASTIAQLKVIVKLMQECQ
jgi:hypothetical protein